MMIVFRTSHLGELDHTASLMLSAFPNHRIFAVEGPIGSGKTTLIKAFCQTLQIYDKVSSPTFSIINVYESPQGLVYHFDLYRLNDMAEFIATGAMEHLESGAYCFIEWPNKALEILPHETIIIKINVEDDGARIYEMEPLPERTHKLR
ncbi:MAG TPA: tRNA (adenosine(37)-N6)-threonylcarbamoyltransferase complex ATPase subunit type 1 TsaE [Bacteroidales bacterium]|jgi:tRNA threonylcarbamoyladenosine biosynthesis protein TsaE|nr:tRNA (adenosine(37)-N6)-threonylcarbamoyltransferase complex ATPase subunit type 1 TsaE [Bacteroidales bacterium]MDI9573252.1 tRNA (adenosine(37)-N6)-threonylcarbamoyltransferase complex ATPase subunit type 1 TsaE [Bacteroidota bacterium]MBP9511307.1 tRNA (adenosine(37)-N6)-threonylcarbamoyltransferase complex ATPase subunit type 1 TsaE [Bacteroidales bacterium]MBP9588162.1 tRNA (adenosine(37)-N6)-threonylcarbamoyltransferase complex ATPase subunit type 1 TsaE [Bacteroidales bacterium]HNQ606